VLAESRPSLKRPLDPKKIAVVGASNSKDKVGGIVFRRLLDSRRRRLFPVNPKEVAIGGHKVSPKIELLPDGIDLAVITAGAGQAVTAVEECIQKGIPNYIVVAWIDTRTTCCACIRGGQLKLRQKLRSKKPEGSTWRFLTKF